MIAELDGGSCPSSLFQIVKVGIRQFIFGVPLWTKLLRSNQPKEWTDLHGGILSKYAYRRSSQNLRDPNELATATLSTAPRSRKIASVTRRRLTVTFYDAGSRRQPSRNPLVIADEPLGEHQAAFAA